MRKNSIIKVFFGVVALAGLVGCSGGQDKDMADAAAKINDYVLSKKEFQTQLVRELEYDNTYKATAQAKQDFLKSIIERELLTQEAKKMGLDRDKKFITAIENYWQATLIKHLIETKNKEILKMISVSEADVIRMYNAQKQMNSDLPPLSDIEADITRAALEEKRALAVKAWIEALHEQADIKINREFINQ